MFQFHKFATKPKILNIISQIIKANSKKKAMKTSPLCDPAGIRTQDPYIKSVLLYQLSYGIEKPFLKSSDPAGIRTQDPYIKSVLLYQLSYGIVCLSK